MCKNLKWEKINTNNNKGSKKCKEKNRFKVGLSTQKPPQIQLVSLNPKKGIEDIILVITVAPQKDIWPQGRTYPKKAEAIVKINIRLPVTHIIFLLNDLFIKDLKIWIYIIKKIIEEKWIWNNWRIKPFSIIFLIKIYEEKEK